MLNIPEKNPRIFFIIEYTLKYAISLHSPRTGAQIIKMVFQKFSEGLLELCYFSQSITDC